MHCRFENKIENNENHSRYKTCKVRQDASCLNGGYLHHRYKTIFYTYDPP